MVLESYHLGRAVPCPWCRASNDVPRQIDFGELDRAQFRDEARGGTLLMLSVLGLFLSCLPLSAWVWWSSNGVLSRAADDGRPGDGLVRAARALAVFACIVQGIVLALVLAAALS